MGYSLGCSPFFIRVGTSVGTRDQTSEGLCWLGRSPFFVIFTRMFNKWGQNAVTPIYTPIPQYPEITGYFFIPSYNRMVPLLTIWKEWSCKNIQQIKTHQASHSSNC